MLALALLGAPAWAQDTDPPVIDVQAGGAALADGALFAGPVTITIQVTDASPVTVDATLDGAAFTSGSTVGGEGSHDLVVTATDDAQNQSSVTLGFEIDTVAPVFGPVLPVSGTLTSGAEVTLQGEVAGAAAVTVNGASATLAGTSFSAGPLALSEGENSFTIVATDAAGNPAQATHRIVRDSTPPAISIEQPAVGVPQSAAAVDVVGTASDAHLDTVTVGGTAATRTGSTFLARNVPLAEGANTVTADATDAAGNSAQAIRSIVLDTQPPAVAITDPAAGTVVPSASLTVSGSASDPHLDRVEVDGVPATLSGGTWSGTASLTEGANTVMVEAFDRLGWSATASVTVTRDTTAPAAAITAPADGAYLQGDTVAVTGTVDDPAATVTVNGVAATVDGTASPPSFAATVPLVEGENRLIARVTDAVGNQGARSRVVYRDTVAPAIERVDPGDGALAVPPESRFEVTFSEPLGTLAAGAWSLELSDGTPILAQATTGGETLPTLTIQPDALLPSKAEVRLVLTGGIVDRAGNALASPPTYSWTTRDVVAPDAPVLAAQPPAHLCAVELALTGSAEAEAVIEVSGGAGGGSVRADENGDFALVVELVPGSLNRLEITATDVDGNRSAATVAEVVQDCRGPSVTGAALAADAVTVAFDEAVDPATLTTASVTLTGASGAIAGTVAITGDGSGATFTAGAALPAEPLRLEVTTAVRDLAGNPLAFPYGELFGAAVTPSFLSGRAIDAATGRPLGGATVVVDSTDGVVNPEPRPEQTTGPGGRFRIPVAAGTHYLVALRPGYTPVFRIVPTSGGAGADVFDPRLTPVAATQTVPAAGGDFTGDDGLELDLPSGALAADTEVSVTPLDEQALPALLPYGWSPRGAVWIDLSGATLAAPATLTLPVDAAPGAPLALVRLDLSTLQWHVEAVENLAGSTVTLPVDAEGAWAAVEADGGAIAPPAPVAGTVLGSASAPAGGEVTAAAITFDPTTVLPSQASRVTIVYTLASDTPSGTPLTVVVQEELTLLDGTVRREPPYEADLVLHRSSPSDPLSGSDPRSLFDLVPSAVARSVPFQVGAEDVTVRHYAGQTVQGNVIGPTGGTVATPEGDRVDLAAGSLAEPAPVLLERIPEADLQAAVPVGTEYLGALELDLSGRTLATPATLALELGAAPGAGEEGLLFQVVDLPATGGPAWRPVAALVATATGWTTAAIDPADLPWPGVRTSGSYLFARLTSPVGYLRGTVFGIGGSPELGALVSASHNPGGAPTPVPWIQLSATDGSYVLPVPVSAIAVLARDPVSGDEAFANATVATADERVDLDLLLQVTDPQVIAIDPADGATEVLTGIEPTVTFSEPVDPTTVTNGVQLFDAGGGTSSPSRVPATVEVQGSLVRLRPLASLRPATLHEVRVNTAVRDFQGNRVAAAVTSSFTTRDDSANTDLDLSKIHLFEPDANGDARVLGRAGAVPAGTLVFVENLSRLIATPSVTAAADGGFELFVEAQLTDRLLLHVVLEGQNEVVVEVTPFLTASGQGARVIDEEEEVVFTTLDGITVRVPADTFREPTTVTVVPRPLGSPPIPMPPGLSERFSYELDFGGAEAFRAIQVSMPGDSGAFTGDTAERYFLLRDQTVLGDRSWMLYDLMAPEGDTVTTELPPDPDQALQALESKSSGTVTKTSVPADPYELYRWFKEHLPGSVYPGRYTLVHEDDAFGFVSIPIVGGQDIFATSAYFVAVINQKIRDTLARDAIMIPTRLDGEPVKIEVRDLTTGYKLFDAEYEPPPDEVLFLPPDSYGDFDAPVPVAGSPLRFFELVPTKVGKLALAPGIETELTADDELIVRGEKGAAALDVQIRLIGLQDEPGEPQIPGGEEEELPPVDETVRSDGENGAAPGSFEIQADVTPGQRYLLAIGGEVAPSRGIEIGFSEALDPAFPGIAVADEQGRDPKPELVPVSGGQVVRIEAKVAWKAGETYTLTLGPGLADASGNEWGRELDLEFRVRASDPRDTYELGAVRDMVRIGGLLFVAADGDGLVVLDASDPASLSSFVNDGTSDLHFPFPSDDPVRGLAVDPHGRVMVVGGGVSSYGELKIFDPLAMDPAAIAAAPNDLAVRNAAFRGSTLLSDALGVETGTILPEGTPRKVAVLSQDRLDNWRIGVDPPPVGVTVTPAVPPSEPEGATEYTVTVSGSGPQQPDGLIHPVTLRDLDRGRWHRVDADAAGSFTLEMEVGIGSRVELIRNDRTLAYVATLGVGIEVVDVDAFYAEDPGGTGFESDVLGIYSGAGEGLELCDEPVPDIAGATLDLGTLFDPEPLATHPLTAAGLIGFRGLAMLESDPADVGELSFYNQLCLKIDGSARVTGMEVLEDFAFDFDEDGKLEKDEEKDYLLVTHLTAGLLVIDATDRDLLSLVGRVRLPGAASHLGIDREERRVYVAASGEGVYVVDLDDPPSTRMEDEDADGIDDRVLETIELEGGTNAPVFLVPELGLAYAGGVERGLTSIVVGEPRIFAVADNAPDPLTEEPPETMRRRVDRLAPFGVPSAPEPPRRSRVEEEEDLESLPGTEEEPEEMPGAFRIMAYLPGGAGAEIFLDMVSLGPGGVEIRGAGDTAAIADLPPTSFTGADGLKLTRLSDNPLDEGYQIYLSEEVAAIADLRASTAFERTQVEEDDCADADRRCDEVPEEAREILSGNSIAIRFPDALRAALEPTYGAGRLDDAELELASVPWDTSPSIHQEPTQNPSYGTGDVAPGTLLHSGEYSHQATDLVVKSRGFDFAFSRTYRNQTIGAGPLGPGWELGFGQRLRELPNGDVELYDGRGRREVFERQEDGSLKPPPGRFATLDGGLARTSAGWLMLTRHGHRVRFDRFGRLLSIADAVKDSEDTGNEMRFRYDVRSRLIQVVDTLDREYTLEYDADDRLVALEDFDERRVQYAYDSNGRLIEVTSPTVSSFGAGLVTAYAYDAAPAGTLAETLTGRDQLDTITDPRGNTWLDLTWTDADGDGRPEEVTTQQWGTDTLQIAYASNGDSDPDIDSAQVTDRRDNVTAYLFDDGGHTTSISEPGGYVSTFELDEEGNLTRTESPSGIVQEFEYADTGSERSGGNVTASRTTPIAGQENGSSTLLTSTLDYQGRTNRPTRVVDPRGTVTDIARTPGGKPQTIVRGAGMPNAPTTSVEYNDYGQPTRIVNANGHVTELHYYEEGESRGYLHREVVDPSGLGLTTTYATDARGNVTVVTDPRGVRHEVEYNELDWAVAEREPSLGYETTYEHDENGNLVTVELPYGNGSTKSAIDRSYGVLDEVLSISMEAVPGLAESAVVQTFQYDENLNPVQVVRPAGQVSTATYDGRDLMTGLLHAGAGLPVAVPESFGYDPDGRQNQYTDGRGETWLTQYDGYGRPAVVTDPLNRTTTTRYDDGSAPTHTRFFDDQGCLVSRADATYDALGRQLAAIAWAWEVGVTGPGCAEPPASARALVTGFTYDPLGNLVSTTDPLGRVTGATYDEAERLVRVQDPAVNVTTFALDEMGNVVTETVQEQMPDGTVRSVAVSHAYDPLNRRTLTIDGEGNPWGFAYDARGNVILEIDPEANLTVRTFDALDRMTSQTRPEDIRVEYVYDPSGRLAVYRDALGNETTYAYDALDRQLSVTFPDQTTETYEYDASSNLVRAIDALGNVVDQGFDDTGRLLSRTVTPATGVIGPTSESYAYDAADRLLQATSGTVTTTRTYDSIGRMLGETNAGRTVSHAYDDAGNEIALGYPSGLVLGREFDVLNRPTAIGPTPALPGYQAQTVTVDPFARYGFRGAGLVAEKALGPGANPAIEALMQYDDAHRLVSTAVNATGSGRTVFGETLTWNARSLKTGQVRTDRNGASLAFAYDRAGRLTEASRVGGGASFDLPDEWGFVLDEAENLLARETRRSTRIEREEMPLDGSGRNRPGSVDGVTLEWDANGNLTRKGDRTFAYDYRNRLTEVHDGTGLVASYAYDAFNRRVAKTVGATTTETVWTGWQALEEYTAGILSARRSFGLGLDEMVRVEADVEGDGTLESTYHPIYDSTGNLVMVLGPDGEPIELYAYSPDGERRVIVNDLTPPAVEQVRVSGGAVVVELSEEVDTEVLEAAVAGGEVTLTDLTDPGTPAAVPFTASWPVTEGRQARRRLVLTPGTAPAAGTALELSVAAEALEDLFGNATTAASTDAFTWPSGDAIVRDATAPRIESVSVEQGSLVIVLSEPADPSAAAAAIDLDGQPLTWTLGADGYTLTSQESVTEGSHTVDIGAGALDLAGLGLPQAFQESFVLAETDHLVYERPDPTLSTTSTIANRYGFHGRPVDPETGFLYFRNRYYDPELGRFVSVDPLGYVDGPNPYQYALNNPASFSDPMGLCLGEGLSCKELGEVFVDAFRGAGRDIADFFTGDARKAKDSGVETAESTRHTEQVLRRNMGNRDAAIDALLAEDYDGLELPSRLHQQELGELGESARAIGETAGHAGRTAGYGISAADRLLLATGLYRIIVVGGRQVLVRQSLEELPRVPRSLGAAAPEIQLTSRIGESSFAVKHANRLSQAAQRDVDNLLAALRTGNVNPGIGTRALGHNFFELRGANAGRVIVKQTEAGSFDIVGKFQGHVRGDAANSAIIKRFMSEYTP